jgi:PPOX class probable F420-dependent enzyme
MAARIPDKFRDLVTTKKAFANLATVSANGAPQVTPVWIDSDGDLLLVNSAKGRVKDRNMRKNARVALSIIDPDNPYRHLAVRGRVVDVTSQGADQHIDKLAKKYMGVDQYPHRAPGEQRVIYKIEPLSVATMG